MISTEEIKSYILDKAEHLRPIDIELIQSFIHNNNQKLIEELKTFQNKDLGFGNGLEADIQMPLSNVASTCVAINILEDIKEANIKETLNKDIVAYLENVYDSKKECFHMVPKEIQEYPHAIWWNYDSLDSFTWGNPNPEVIGFLYQNRQFITKLDINHLITKTIAYIRGPFKNEVSMHSVLSVLRFYKRCDKDIKNLIKDDLTEIVSTMINLDKNKWTGYALEPYMVAIIDKSFLSSKQDLLNENLDMMYENILKELPTPSWQWYQYEDVFEKVKNDWIGLLTYNQIKALRINRK